MADQDEKPTTDTTEAGTPSETAGEPDEIDLTEVNKILSSSGSDAAMPKSMQKLEQRERDNTKRIQKSIKGTKTNPGWFVPVFCALMLIGLLWIVVNYITGGQWPIPSIGNWNLLIGFLLMLAGFIMTRWWR